MFRPSSFEEHGGGLGSRGEEIGKRRWFDFAGAAL